ncbi:hypothetical protein N1851_021782 [Merluccius polli]|uniref:Uncharacterized protein n=1 Tax=Merluccius polli TaxID=89951 RepID=A0AA47MJD8_MERPO|nr:hypothetical protein N1851_021782 [Merluccius polli]
MAYLTMKNNDTSPWILKGTPNWLDRTTGSKAPLSSAVLQNSGHHFLPQNSQRIQGILTTPDTAQFTWGDLVTAAQQSLHGAAVPDSTLPGPDHHDAEVHLLKACQVECFPEEVKALKSSKPVLPSSRLRTLSLDLDGTTGLIRVGGRLRHMNLTDIHPIVLDPHHAVTKLFSISIKDLDERILHPGTDRVFAEL